MRVSVLAAVTTIVHADFPMFCQSSCAVTLPTTGERRVYLHIPDDGRKQFSGAVTVNRGAGEGTGAPIKAFVPQEYDELLLNASGSVAFGTLTIGSTPLYNPYFQTVEYPLLTTSGGQVLGSLDTEGSVTLSVSASGHYPNGVNILFKMGQPYQVTALELVAMPIGQWLTHAYWWTQRMYFYLFFAGNFVLAVLYCFRTRCRLWQWLLVFAIAAFSSVAGENTYHAIVAGTRGGSTSELSYTIACVCILANAIPATVAALFMRHGKWQNMWWSVFAILVGAGFVFLAGSGWYVGCALLMLAGCVRLTRQLPVCSWVRVY